MDWVSLLNWIFGGAGLLGIVSSFLFFRANKRIKTAEANEKEIENLKTIIEQMKNQILFLNEQINSLYKQLGEKDAVIGQISREGSLREIKYAQKKKAISQAHDCPYSNDCPVLAMQAKLEEGYLRKIEKNENK